MMAHEHPTPRTYFVVFVALLVLLAVTTVLAFVDLDALLPGHFWGIAIAMTVAFAKGLLIMLYFLHVKSGPRRAVVFACAGFVWLGILLTLTFSDYLTRNYPPDLTYKGEPRYLNR